MSQALSIQHQRPEPLDLESYDYELPLELIAQHPLPQRDGSRLMYVNRQDGSLKHMKFNLLPQLLQKGDLLVLNDSKVIPARLFGKKQNGTKIEVLLLNEVSGSSWKCMVHPGKRLKQEQCLEFSNGLQGFVSLPDSDGLRIISFKSKGDFWDQLKQVGHVPLPPYIKPSMRNIRVLWLHPLRVYILQMLCCSSFKTWELISSSLLFTWEWAPFCR